MSFKPSISAVAIANEALAMLPADPIQTEDEQSLEGREFRRFYKSTVAALLERHHWSLASKRTVLALKANDREDEWAWSYAKPVDLAYPVAMLPTQGVGWRGWFMQDYRYIMPSGRALFMQNGNTIYSMVEAATLEYTSFDITEGDFTTRFKDIVVLALAAKMCEPVTKDQGKARELLSRAEFETQRAIASDLNRNRPTYGNSPTETEIVRGEGIDLNYFGGYPLDPVANPANTGF